VDQVLTNQNSVNMECGKYKMKITKRQLKRIIREEYSKLIKESSWDSKSTHGGRSPMRKPIGTYGQQIIDAQRGNQLPPQSSNWYGFAQALDIGVLDLDELAYDLGFKSFAHLDAAISPRGLSQSKAEEVADIMFGINGADEVDVYDALDKPYRS